MARKNRGINEAFRLNQKTLAFYRQKLRLLATTCFEWEGLPNSIPERFIEQSLYYHGLLAFVNDPEVGLICCKCNQSGQPNLYNEGVRYTLYADNGYNKTFDRENIILLRNNKDEIPTITFTDYYIYKLFNIDRTIDVNITQQKTPRIITCDETQKLTLENLLMQYEGNTSFIFGYKSLDVKGLESIDLTAPYVSDKLQTLKTDLWKEFLETIGVNVANTSKKERLVTDEVNSNNELILLAGDIFHESRQIAAKQLSELCGNVVTVKRRCRDVELYSNIEDNY